GITVYAPPKPAAPPEGEAKAKPPGEGGPADKGKRLGKEQFRYDRGEGAYYCPEGKRLGRISRTTLKRANGIELPMAVYQASGEDCRSCPRRQGCTSSAAGRRVKRYEGEEALERLEARMREAENKEVYRLRKQSVELGYADLKGHRGLRVFRCFGI